MDNPSQQGVISRGVGAASSRAWHVLTVLLVLLLAVCGIWIGMSGFSAALNSSGFQWMLIATAVVLIWRVGGPFAFRLLRGEETVDGRGYVDMSWRSQWFKRGR